jgi:phage-related tail protein
MNDKSIELLEQICRMIMDERKLLQEHISLTRPSTTESDLFLVGLKTAFEAMTRRLSVLVESLDKLTQHTMQMEKRLEILEQLIAPMHKVAYELIGKCSTCREKIGNNDTSTIS